MRNIGLEKAIAFVGNQRVLANKCGKAQSTISDWLNGNKRVAPETVPALVKATEGRVLAYEFRPDLPDLFPRPSKVS
ncbi:helix-turn-helix domain-containing protein [Candidatus Fukatsuia symbiotica]|uniref:Transcriptional regulator n=1 Tax=Candidatus Fukatsuia symbiotica TaxID=1878942 RepID=A0A2U8I4N9_9GAMM|nr:helix-turn-helix domain-containing protein [Candidatus Fukatsuia symbiotica]AWK14113.1 transcriptional regulator [Candidatus Fukatsuia symbiotica]MEA9446114.1 helix-turn-helix domain-containing protein [Candidatus Fukatsuia symbiotica]